MLDKHADLTAQIISAFYFVYNALGWGFLEKIYKNAFAHELRKRGFQVDVEVPIQVVYDGVIMGEYFADIVVNGVVILELKAVSRLTDSHEAQLLHYLRATHFEVGLLFNFGPEPEFQRKIYDDELKMRRRRNAEQKRGSNSK